MTTAVETLFLRRPAIEYVSPAICDFVFSSGSGENILILDPIYFPPGPVPPPPPPPEPPSAPTAIDATNVVCGTFSANWNAVDSALGYRLDVATDSGFSAFVAGYSNLDVGNVTTYPVVGLDLDTEYFYRVRAYNADGVSDSSNVMSATTEFSPECIDGLALWLDANIGVTASGSDVTAWADQSGNGNNLVAGSSGSPQLGNSVFANGSRHIQMCNAAGLSGRWLVGSGPLVGLSGVPVTVFAVVQFAVYLAQPAMIISNLTGGFYTVDIGTSFADDYYNGTNDGRALNMHGLGGTSVQVMVKALTGTPTFYDSLSGTPLTPSMTGGAGAVGLNGGSLVVGAYNAAGAFPFFQNRLAALLVYDGALSDADRVLVTQYLITKFL